MICKDNLTWVNKHQNMTSQLLERRGRTLSYGDRTFSGVNRTEAGGEVRDSSLRSTHAISGSEDGEVT